MIKTSVASLFKGGFIENHMEVMDAMLGLPPRDLTNLTVNQLSALLKSNRKVIYKGTVYTSMNELISAMSKKHEKIPTQNNVVQDANPLIKWVES